jgi:ParB/RepB/Spo0J family partition protein
LSLVLQRMLELRDINLRENSSMTSDAVEVAATNGAAQNGNGRYKTIPLSSIRPSETNPRKQFDKTALQELAHSIAEHGVLQPITVRTINVTDGFEYEIIVGERRWRASQLAKQETIACIVRNDLTNEQIELVQWIENLQRDDLTPIEEAEGYLKLIESHQVTVEEIADNVGKSKSHVQKMICLASLPKLMKAAVANGDVKVATAVLFGRIRDSRIRVEAVKQFFDAKLKDVKASHTEIAMRLIQTTTLDLSHAPFDPDDAEILPKAGSCSSCPKLSKNSADLFSDAPGNLCTDPTCYRAKLDAIWAVRKQAAEAEGQKVFTEAECAELYSNRYRPGELSHEAGQKWLDLDETTWMNGKNQVWRKLLGPNCPKPRLARAHDGSIHELVPKEETLNWARDTGLSWAKAYFESRQPRQQSKAEREQYREQVRTEKVRKAYMGLLTFALAEKLDTMIQKQLWDSAEFWLRLLETLRQKSYDEEIRLLVKARGWQEKKVYPRESFDKHLKQLNKAPDIRILFWQLFTLTGIGWKGSKATDLAKLLAIQTKPLHQKADSIFPKKTGAKPKEARVHQPGTKSSSHARKRSRAVATT